MAADSDSYPRLLCSDGQRYIIATGRTTIGRNPDAQVWLNDPTVGRQHAELTRSGGGVSITDLRSKNGTWVNDRRVAEGESVWLRHGDCVRVGTKDLRYTAPVGNHDTIGVPPTTPRPEGSFSMDQQQAGQINNVGRDQYLQAIYAQRESFLRDVAASRTRAKRLIWLGFLLFVGGFGLFAWTIMRAASTVNDADPTEPPEDFFGPEVGGVPTGFIGWAAAGLGTLLMIVGIVLHVVATSRQRRAVNQPIVMPGWAAPTR